LASLAKFLPAPYVAELAEKMVAAIVDTLNTYQLSALGLLPEN
jgi:hypothetical protein